MANSPRQDRETDERDSEKREEAWKPPSLLPTPKPRPGWRYRWVRASIMGAADNVNVSYRFREGYEQVPVSECPELAALRDNGSKFTDGVEIGGLLLCRIPEERAQAIDRHYEKLSRDQESAVDNQFMRENDARMPLFKDKRTQVRFGGRGDK
jgi:hypothetical protein